MGNPESGSPHETEANAFNDQMAKKRGAAGTPEGTPAPDESRLRYIYSADESIRSIQEGLLHEPGGQELMERINKVIETAKHNSDIAGSHDVIRDINHAMMNVLDESNIRYKHEMLEALEGAIKRAEQHGMNFRSKE